ncbi:MAG: peptide chain release factor-like protein [Deltaproteobacteria bacterium]|jgi:peptide chain release factor|nr:peptide chain release factor-like protein [Deltaproteobacteria bacterium]
MSLIQISSGRGPAECELAAGLFVDWLLTRSPRAAIVQREGVRSFPGLRTEGCRSALVELPDGSASSPPESHPENPPENPPEGTLLWICRGPLRKNCGRRNWFFQATKLSTTSSERLQADLQAWATAVAQGRDLKVETFRSPGRGGQNVNKVETGVRVVHQPSGLSASSTTARSQKDNKSLAVERLLAKLAELGAREKLAVREAQWRRHDRLVRGNPTKTFVGLEFRPL